MVAVELQHGGQLMDFGSRGGYGDGGDGFGSGSIGGRSGYDMGVGFGDAGMGGRSGYGNGGSGFD